jgi:nitrogen fixation protein
MTNPPPSFSPNDRGEALSSSSSSPSSLPGGGCLKLIAQKPEEITILAACVQDAIIPLADMTFIEEEQRFIAVANRFRWEHCACGEAELRQGEDGQPIYERTNTALIEGALGAQYRGFDRQERQAMLSLLTLELALLDATSKAPSMAPAQDSSRAPKAEAELKVYFAGGAGVKIKLAAGWRVYLRDIGTPWPTRLKPRHALTP